MVPGLAFCHMRNCLRKLPRQADTPKIELPANPRNRRSHPAPARLDAIAIARSQSTARSAVPASARSSYRFAPDALPNRSEPATRVATEVLVVGGHLLIVLVTFAADCTGRVHLFARFLPGDSARFDGDVSVPFCDGASFVIDRLA